MEASRELHTLADMNNLGPLYLQKDLASIKLKNLSTTLRGMIVVTGPRDLHSTSTPRLRII